MNDDFKFQGHHIGLIIVVSPHPSQSTLKPNFANVLVTDTQISDLPTHYTAACRHRKSLCEALAVQVQIVPKVSTIPVSALATNLGHM